MSLRADATSTEQYPPLPLAAPPASPRRLPVSLPELQPRPPPRAAFPSPSPRRSPACLPSRAAAPPASPCRSLARPPRCSPLVRLSVPQPRPPPRAKLRLPPESESPRRLPVSLNNRYYQPGKVTVNKILQSTCCGVRSAIHLLQRHK
jgi:hypothetical protein